MSPLPFHIAFYRFVRIGDVQGVAAALRLFTEGLCGNILVAPEGISGTVAADAPALDDFERAVRSDPRMHGLFAELVFQRSACVTAPFKRMKVHARAEVLPLGVGTVDAVGRPGRQLDPAAWDALLADENAVVIDNRNSFEYRLGHFRGAVDPGVGNFRDLPRYIEANAPAWKAQGKKVAMYCTGGIRCEKTAVWMADAFGLEVSQLEGGILRYLAETDSNRSAWQGECFVFDNRIALDHQLKETPTTAAQVYAGDPDEAWRLQRALRLDAADPDR